MASKTKQDPLKEEEYDLTVIETDEGVEASFTFKGDGAFYSPWLVIKHKDVDRLYEEIQKTSVIQDLMKEGAVLAKGYYQLAQQIPGDSKPQGGGGSKPTGSRPGPKDHPDGKTEFCEHGQMTYKSGVSQKTDKPWRAFDCPQGVCDRKWDRS